MLFPQPIHAARFFCVCALSWLLSLLPANAAQVLPPQQTNSLPPILKTGTAAWAAFSSGALLNLNNYFHVQDVAGTVVRFTFVSGTTLVSGSSLASGTNTVDIVLSDSDAPVSVANFLYYVNAGSYDNTFIHRSPGNYGIVQGGGFGISRTADLSQASLIAVSNTGSIINESNDTTRPNQRGTIAMARTSDPNSATTQWFFNTDDNSTIFGGAAQGGTGYAVFGTVLNNGMDVVDQIHEIPPQNLTGLIDGNLDSNFATIPLRNAPSGTGLITVPRSDLVMIASARVTAPLWSVSSDHPEIVQASVASNGVLSLTAGTVSGAANITVTITDSHGAQTSGKLTVNSQLLDSQSPPAGGEFAFEFPQFYYSCAQTGLATVYVQRLAGAGATSSVYYTTTNGSLADGADYTAVHGLLTFGPNDDIKSFQVPIGATKKAGSIAVHLVSVSPGASLASQNTDAVLYIDRSTQPMTVQFQQPAFSGVSGGIANVVLTRSGPNTAAVSAFVQLLNTTAAYGTDYTVANALGSTLRVDFPAGSSWATIPVTLSGSNIGASFTAQLIGVDQGFIGGQNAATVTFNGVLAFSATNYNVAPGSSSAIATIAVTTSGTNVAQSVAYSTVARTGAGTATAGVDYTPVSGVLTFAAGQTVATFDVPILAVSASTDRTLGVHLSQVSANETAGSDATLTIVHNTQASPIALSANSYNVDAGSTLNIPLVYTGTTGSPTVGVQMTDNSAIYNTDYQIQVGGAAQPAFSTVQLASGSAVTVAASSAAAGKNFTVKLVPQSADSIVGTPSEATVTISSETFAFSPATYLASPSASEVSLSVVRTGTAAESVIYNTANDSATAGIDYTATSGTLAFAAGESSKFISIPILNPSSTAKLSFKVQLSNGPANAYYSAANVVIDHSADAQTVQFASMPSRAAVSGTLNVTLTRSGSSGSAVAYIRLEDGTAVLGTDYIVSGISGNVATATFADGTNQATLPITFSQTGIGKTFSLELLTGDQMAVTGSDTVSFTIVDLFQFTPTAATYRVSGSIGQAVLAVTRSGTAAGESVAYASADNTAVSGTDYTATSGTLAFAANEQLKTFSIPVASLSGTDVAFGVQLTSLSNDSDPGSPASVVIAGSATPVVQFTGSTFNVGQGDSVSIALTTTGTTDTTATVLLSGSAVQGTDYTISGSAIAASNGNTIDVTVPAGGTATLSIAAGANSDGKQISLNLLTTGTKSAVGPNAAASVVITDTFSFSPLVYNIQAPATANGQAVLAVTRTTSTGSASVIYNTDPTGAGTAASGTDYTATSGTLNFVDGQTEQTFTVPLLVAAGSTDLSFPVRLTSTSAAYVTGSDATVVIAHNSQQWQVISLSPTNYEVTQSGSLNIVLTRQGGTAGSGTTTLRIENGTAVLGSDFTVAGATGDLVTVAFPANSSTSNPITITTNSGSDGKSFGLRILAVQNDAAGNYSVGSQSLATVAIGEIVQFLPATYTLSGTVTQPFLLEVIRSGTTADETVAYTPVDGTAVTGTDYQLTAGTLTFPAGVHSQTISGTVFGVSSTTDSSFSVHLASTTSLTGSDAVVSIARSADTPWIALEGTTATPGQAFYVQLVRSDTSGSPIAVLRIEDGTAVQGTDYSIVNARGDQVVAAFTDGNPIALVAGTVALQSSGKSFSLRLLTASSGYTLGSPASIAVKSLPMFLMQDSACSALASSGTAVVVVRRTAADTAETVQYSTADGTAVSGTQYTTANGTLSFPAGAFEEAISIPLLAGSGSNFTGTKTFNVTLSSPSGGYSIPSASATATVSIVYDSAHTTYSFTTNAYTFDALTGGTVTVLRSGSASSAETVSIDILDGSAIAAQGDYTTNPAANSLSHTAVLTFQPADTSKTLTVSGSGGAEKYFKLHIGGSGTTVPGTTPDAVVTLRPNGALQLSAVGYRVDQATGDAVVTVIRHGGTTGPVTVAYNTSDGPLPSGAGVPSAIAGIHYLATNGTLSFADGVWFQDIHIPLKPTNSAVDRAFTITLSNPGGGALLGSPTQCSVTLFRTAAGGAVSFDNTEYQIDCSGSGGKVTIVRNNASQAATVTVTAIDNTAYLNLNDYGFNNGTARTVTVKFAAGQVSLDVLVSSTATSPKTFFLQLGGVPASGAQGATSPAIPATARVTLIPNPVRGRIEFTSPSYRFLESASNAVVTLVRTGTQGTVSVTYLTDDGTADSSGTTTGVVVFNPGETKKNLAVPSDPAATNSDRVISVRLQSASGGAVVGALDQTDVTIVQSAPGGMFTLTGTGYRMIAQGLSIPANLKIVRSATGQTATVYAQLLDGTAILDTDYNYYDPVYAARVVGQRLVPIVFQPTDSEQDLELVSTATVNKNLMIQLVDSSPGSAIGTPNTATVAVVAAGSNQLINLSQDACTVMGGSSYVYLNVLRSDTTGTVTVSCSTHDATAIAGRDYTPVNQIVTFNPGEASEVVAVPLLASNATAVSFTVNLVSPSGNAILGGTSQAAVTIVSGAPSGAIQFGQSAYRIDNTIGASGVIKVVRTTGIDTTATVNVFLNDGTAVFGTDYLVTLDGSTSFGQRTIPGVFNPGDSEISFRIVTTNTTEKTLTLELSGDPIGANNTAPVTLLASGSNGVIEFGSPTYRFRSNSGNATLTVNRIGGSGPASVNVTYSTADGSAVAGSEYLPTAGSVLTFYPGETQKTISIPLIASARNERAFTVTLASATGGASVGAINSTVVTVYNTITGSTYAFTSPYYTFVSGSFQSVTIARTNAGAAGSVYVELLNGTAQFDITGTQGSGFLTNGSHTGDAERVDFAAGQSTGTLFIGGYSGQPGTMGMRLVDAPPGSGFGVPSTATVFFDSIGFAVPSYRVGPAAHGVAYLTVTRSGTSGTATVNYAASNGAGNGTLIFQPGVNAQDIEIPFKSSSKTQSFTVYLSNPTGTILNPASTSTVVVAASNPHAKAVEFTSASFTLLASQGLTAYTMLSRSGTDAAVVYVEMIDGTAKQDTDFFTSQGGRLIPVVFQRGQTVGYIGLYAPVSTAKSFAMRIVSVPSGYKTGSQSYATVYVASASIFAFEPNLTANALFSDADREIAVPVQRAGTAGTASVQYIVQVGKKKRSPVSLTFQPGESEQIVRVPIDKNIRSVGRVHVTLSSPSDGSFVGTPSTVVATLIKKPASSTFHFDRSAYRANCGAQQTIVIRRTNYAVAAGVYLVLLDPAGVAKFTLPTAPTRQLFASGKLEGFNFAAGQQTITLNVTGTVGTGDRQVSLFLAGATAGSAVSAPDETTISFIDGSYPALVQFAPPSYAVQDTAKKVTVTLTRTRTGGTVSVPWTTNPGTAKAGHDFIAKNGTATFEPGQSILNFDLPLVHDRAARENLSFSVGFSGPPSGNAIKGAQDSATITLGKAPIGSFSFKSSGYRFDAGQQGTITIVRSTAHKQPTTVYLLCEDGAGAGYGRFSVDYSVSGQSAQIFPVSFAPDQTTASVVLWGNAGKGDKTTFMRIVGCSPESAIGSLSRTTVTFVDPISDSSVVEFFPAVYSVDASARRASVSILRAGTSDSALTVHCARGAGSTAEVSGPLAGVTGTNITFATGELVRVIDIPFTPPADKDRVLTLNLQPIASTTTIGAKSTAVITVNRAASNGLFGFKSGSFRFVSDTDGAVTIVRTGHAKRAATVYVQLSGNAVLGSDYTSANTPDGRAFALNFAPNQRTASFTIHGFSGLGDKGLQATLIGSTADSGIGKPAQADISFADSYNPYGVVSFAPAAYYANEANAAVTLYITRTGTAGTVTVAYQTVNGTARSGADYVQTKGTVTFQPGETVHAISVWLKNDKKVAKSLRNFTVRLTSIGGDSATVGASDANAATVTIFESRNSHGVFRFENPAWSFNRSADWAELVILRTDRTAGAVTLSLSVADTGLAARNLVYQWPANLTAIPVHFAPGQDRQSVFIPLIDPTLGSAGTRSFTAQIQSASAGLLGLPATATITAVDATSVLQPSVELASTQYRVNDNAGTLTVTANLVGSATGTVTVPFSIQPGTASPGTDFDLLGSANPTAGTLVFPLGTTSASLTLSIKHDKNNKTPWIPRRCELDLGQPSAGAALLDQTAATVTIVDTAAPEGVFEFTSSAYSCDSDCGAVSLVLHRSGSGAVRVIVTTEDGTLVGNQYASSKNTVIGHPNFAAIRQTVDFASGQKSQTVPVQILGGTGAFLVRIESLETIATTPGATKAVVGARDRAVVTVIDPSLVTTTSIDFDQPSYDANDTDGSILLTVRRSDGSAGTDNDALQVDYAVTSGNGSGMAIPKKDYLPAHGTLTFGANQFVTQIPVRLLHRPLAGDRKFTVTLSNPRDITSSAIPVQFLANNPVTVTIHGTTKPYGQFQFDRASYTALGESGQVDVMVLRTGNLSKRATVAVRTADRAAVGNYDYLERIGAITFDSGEAYAQVSVPIRSSTTGRDFVVGLYPTATGAVGAIDLATVTIAPLNLLAQIGTPSLELGSPSYSVDNVLGKVTLSLRNYVAYQSADSVAVHVNTYLPNPPAPEDAKPWSEFTPFDKQFKFTGESPNLSSTSFTIPIHYIPSETGTHTFFVRITSAVNSGNQGVDLLANQLVPVSILPVTRATGGVFDFDSPTYSAHRSSGSVVFHLKRFGNTGQQVGVALAIVPNAGTGAPGVDYAWGGANKHQYPESTVIFAPGQSEVDVTFDLAQTLPATIPPQTPRTVYFELLPLSGQYSNGAVVGTQNVTELTIYP